MTFRKEERLGGWHAFVRVLDCGKRFSSGQVKLFVALRAEEDPAPSALRAGFSTPKKIFSLAVDRNQVRRWMREAYRTMKSDATKAAASGNKRFDCIFMAYDPDVEWEAISEHVTKLSLRLTEFIRSQA